MTYRIVVADDDIDSAETLAYLLRSDGHDVRTATRGTQALHLVMSFRPRLALLDLGMPDLDGYEIARRVRGNERDEPTVLIAVTGWTQPRHRERAMAAGYDDYYLKPIEPAVIGELVRRLR